MGQRRHAADPRRATAALVRRWDLPAQDGGARSAVSPSGAAGSVPRRGTPPEQTDQSDAAVLWSVDCA